MGPPDLAGLYYRACIGKRIVVSRQSFRDCAGSRRIGDDGTLRMPPDAVSGPFQNLRSRAPQRTAREFDCPDYLSIRQEWRSAVALRWKAPGDALPSRPLQDALTADQ